MGPGQDPPTCVQNTCWARGAEWRFEAALPAVDNVFCRRNFQFCCSNKDVTASAAKGLQPQPGAMRVTLGYLLTAAGLGHMCLGALLFFNASMMQTVRLRFVFVLGFLCVCVCVWRSPRPPASLPRPRRNVLTRASTQGNLLFVPGESRPRAGRTPCSVILPPTHKKNAFLIDTPYLLFNLLHTNTSTIITTITTIHNQRAL